MQRNIVAIITVIMLIATTISEYLAQYPVQWKNEMPDGCPPLDVLIPDGHTFFRYTLFAARCEETDFLTYRQLNPDRDWGELLPLASGLSVINSLEKARRNLKLPMLRKYKGIAELVLNPTDGVVQQTGVHLSHYTWWQTTSFNMNHVKMLPL